MVEGKGLFNVKMAGLAVLVMLLIVPASGCFGGDVPTLEEEMANMETALANYNSAKNLYNKGDFQDAKQAFIASVEEFKARQSSFDRIAKSDVSALEKKEAGNLAGSSMQYAHAAAYMRDACTEELKPGSNNAYLMKVSADEFEMTAKLNYETARGELQEFWSSH